MRRPSGLVGRNVNMWALIGYNPVYNVYSFECSGKEEIVALFSTEKLANQYLKKATLKKRKPNGSFRYKSVLYGYCEAYITYLNDYVPVVDPEL